MTGTGLADAALFEYIIKVLVNAVQIFLKKNLYKNGFPNDQS
jgi:hypothetical protein